MIDISEKAFALYLSRTLKMTHMKRSISLIPALLCVLAFMASCRKAPELTVTGATTIEISADGGSGSFTFLANRDWRINYSDTWITINPTSGAASDGAITISVRANANTTYEDRSARVTIQMEELSQTVTVKQAQNDALIVKETSFDVPFGGKEIELKVDANVAFDVKPSVDWIHLISTKALISSTVKLSVDENPTYVAREGKVEIAQQNGVLKYSVTVKQAARIAVSSVELDKADLLLLEGDTEKLVATVKPDDATDKTVTWKSSNTAVAIVDNTGMVKAVSVGVATITATAGEISASCPVTVQKTPEGAVDLGVIMTREDGSRYRLFWAKCNIGATEPWGLGSYYAWGETETKSDFSWATYKFRVSGDSTDNLVFSKYNTRTTTGQVDNKLVLDSADDVAHVVMGGKWRMPTAKEWEALAEQCTWTWTTQDGVSGYEVKSSAPGNKSSIILPGGGAIGGTYGMVGYYWSSSLAPSYPFDAISLEFKNNRIFAGEGGSWEDRRYGLSVRAVSE